MQILYQISIYIVNQNIDSLDFLNQCCFVASL